MMVVTALIKPQMEGRVVRALHELPEFPGFSLVEARGQGRGRGTGGAYTATEYDFTYLRHLQLQIVCRSDLVSDVCSAIAKAAWTGHKGDGVIFTSGVASFVRIREAGHRTEEGDQ
ncbi:MAG TPA: P-II family nitrogen regulator [Pseudolabrys sp.]|nr:P-II family nitrogen regulator [Pseudolabrys sp.]